MSDRKSPSVRAPRAIRILLSAASLLVLLLSYNMRGFKNMNNPEAMDSAQLARNIAEGKGYKTLCIRPFSVYLLESAYANRFGPAPIGDRNVPISGPWVHRNCRCFWWQDRRRSDA